MNLVELQGLEPDRLAEYVWKRLRRESPMDPPLSPRFGEEEPESILIAAAERDESGCFRRRLFEAVRDNLRRLARLDIVDGDQSSISSTSDQQIAGLAFLTAELKGVDLVGDLYRFSLAWFLGEDTHATAPNFARTHLLRTLAQLTRNGDGLEGFWKDLWERGPRSLRAIYFQGWVRSNQEAALGRLGELVDSADEIDLPITVWSLVGGSGPGIVAVARSARNCTPAQKDSLRRALVEVGAPAEFLRDFELNVGLPIEAHGDFHFPPSIPRTPYKIPIKWFPDPQAEAA